MPFYLIYTSQPRAEMTPEMLTEIAKSSARNNKKRQITGMLLCIENKYLQYLEGDEKNVLELFEKIKLDGRHHGITKWIQGNADKRIFGDWSMASWMLSKDELESLPVLREMNDFLSKSTKPQASAGKFIEMMRNILDNWIAHHQAKTDPS